MLTEAKNNLKFILLSMKYNVQRQMTNSTSFIMNVILMIANNVSMIIQWLVYFSLSNNFNGHTFKQQMLVIALCCFSYGLTFLFFAGVNNISTYIEIGGLDKYLVKPKSVLISVMTSETRISALGDLIFSLIIIFIYYHKPSQILLFLFLGILSFIIEITFLIIINSITFWFIRFSDTIDTAIGSYNTFSTYPSTIFNKAIKILMFTIIPIGFAIYLPTSLFSDFNICKLLIVISFTIFNVLFARFLFYKGLKRYTSSNMAVINV